jgi:putative ABC transport system permease protein
VLPVAVEGRLARELSLGIGDTVEIGSAAESLQARAVITAIYQPPADPTTITRGEFRLRMHLPDLAALLGASDRVDRFGVALAPGVTPDSAAEVLNRIAFGFRAYSTADIASQSSQTFRVVSRFHRAIAVISIGASAVFLLCIMLLKVEERRLDAAVMRFVGIGRGTIFLSLLLEATVVAAVGSLAGVVLAEAAGSLTNLYYQRFFQTNLVFSLITPGIILFSVGLSIGLGLAAGAIAAVRLVHTRPLVLWGRG